MVARATIAEIDFVRMGLEESTELFRDSVVAALRGQDGYEGCFVLVSPQGQALALTFWTDEEAADAGLKGGRSFYAEQVEKFVTIYRSPPGRETYDVVVADFPAVSVAV
jgi:heme-degrading monooxygenase HmoA